MPGGPTGCGKRSKREGSPRLPGTRAATIATSASKTTRIAPGSSPPNSAPANSGAAIASAACSRRSPSTPPPPERGFPLVRERPAYCGCSIRWARRHWPPLSPRPSAEGRSARLPSPMCSSSAGARASRRRCSTSCCRAILGPRSDHRPACAQRLRYPATALPTRAEGMSDDTVHWLSNSRRSGIGTRPRISTGPPSKPSGPSPSSRTRAPSSWWRPGASARPMIARNIAHVAVLAGTYVLFTTAAQLLLDLGGQESTHALARQLHATGGPLVIDEVGYLSCNARGPSFPAGPCRATQDGCDRSRNYAERSPAHLSRRASRRVPVLRK